MNDLTIYCYWQEATQIQEEGCWAFTPSLDPLMNKYPVHNTNSQGKKTTSYVIIL